MFLYAKPLPLPQGRFYFIHSLGVVICIFYLFFSFARSIGFGIFFFSFLSFFLVLSSLSSILQRRRDVRGAMEAGGIRSHQRMRMRVEEWPGGVLCIFMVLCDVNINDTMNYHRINDREYKDSVYLAYVLDACFLHSQKLSNTSGRTVGHIWSLAVLHTHKPRMNRVRMYFQTKHMQSLG